MRPYGKEMRCRWKQRLSFHWIGSRFPYGGVESVDSARIVESDPLIASRGTSRRVSHSSRSCRGDVTVEQLREAS